MINLARCCRYLTLFIAIVALLVLVNAVQAQTSLTPTQTLITGTRNNIAERILLLQTTEPLRGLQFVALDIPDTSGEYVLPARAIQAALPQTELAANSFLTLSLTVNLAGVPSGQYQGEVQVRHEEGVISLPLTVRVKDNWFWPLLTLSAGIFLAVGLSIYRAKGKPRDELLMRLGMLQTGIHQEDALDEQFRARIESALVDMETALRLEAWPEAQAAIEQAEKYWTRWRKARADWLAQLAYITTLREEITKLQATPSQYLQRLEREATTIYRRAPELESPEQLQEQLETVTEQINRYTRLKGMIDQVKQTSNQLLAIERATWWQKARDWLKRLDEIEPGDETEWKALYAAIEADQPALAQALVESQETSEDSRSIDTGSRDLASSSIGRLFSTPVVAALRLDNHQNAISANWRLLVFKGIGYGLTVVFLAGAGFAELYVGKATFGDNAWGDYLALLVWGFGAEASRSAVVDMLKGWGLHGAT